MIQLAPSGEPVTVKDIVVTLLERDHETLHGTLANLWFLLLTHPEEQQQAISDRRLMKLAYLETLRHSTPVLSAHRYARHEIERFGRLIPEGAQLVCSAAAANRDPKIFNDPDSFIVDRKDMCQRESRGQYRADGLAAGIAFGLGKPSIHPAIPEDRRPVPLCANTGHSRHSLRGARFAPGQHTTGKRHIAELVSPDSR